MGRSIPLTMLPHEGTLAKELRTLYFYRAFGLKEDQMRILSFGACNFRCPYCKRGTFEEDQGIDENALEVSFEQLKRFSLDAISKEQVIRISGGDPVMYPEQSIALGEFVKSNGGRFSMAHNGSGPKFAKKIAPLLECAAIDIKGSKDEYQDVAGVNGNAYETAFRTIEELLRGGVIVDVRTPIFGFTKFENLREIARRVNELSHLGRLFYTIRLFKDVNHCDFPEPPKEVVMEYGYLLKKEFPFLPMGMRTKWDSNNAFVLF